MSANQLALVKELAKREEDKKLEQLQRAQHAVKQDQFKLEQLESYRKQYIAQLHASNDSLNSRKLLQQHAFIAKLDQAIGQQQQALSRTILFKDQCNQHWVQAQRKTQAMGNLLLNKQREAEVERGRKEQKTHDDFALQRLIQHSKR